MSVKAKKIIYGVLLLGGTLIFLSPFLFAAFTGNESIIQNNSLVYPLTLSGLSMVIAASIYAKRAFVCPACKQRLTTHQGGTAGTYAGGLLGTFRILSMKRCPLCGTELI